MTDASIANTTAPGIGLGPLRAAPAGMPDPAIVPPTIAEAGDPFTTVRVIDLIARLERGRAIRLADIADRLDATYLDWLFPVPVVADVALQLQANWMADYRNSSGIIVEDGPSGADPDARGFEPRRSVDRPPGPARRRRLYRAARRVQPTRPTVRRLTTRSDRDPFPTVPSWPPGHDPQHLEEPDP